MVVIRITDAMRAEIAAVHQDDDERWAEFCATIETRINEVRAETTDAICGTCGSTTPEIKDRKWCPRCQSFLIVARFSRDKARSDGLHPICKACESARGKAYRTKVARRGERRAS